MRLWMVDDPLRLLLVLLRIGVLPVMAALPVAAACIVCNRLLFKSADMIGGAINGSRSHDGCLVKTNFYLEEDT